MKARNPQIPYSHEDLFGRGAARIYTGRELDEIAFPLGGIGTGMISLGGWGQLRDFEVFNRPHKGLAFNYTFFTLFAKKGDDAPVTRVVQGPVSGANFTAGGSGITRLDGSGLPHFRAVQFVGSFPIARLDFDDPKMPLTVSMEAFNPFIPLNPDDSGLPAAMFLFHLSNPSDEPVEAVLFANLENKSGHPEPGNGVIEYFEHADVRGLRMSTTKYPEDSPRYGSFALATPHRELNVQTHWFRGGWFDSLHRFWDQASEGELEEDREPATAERGTDIGSIGLRVTVAPGESTTLPVWIIWHTPNFVKYWGGADPKPVWRNHYATRFADAVAVADYLGTHHERLESQTREFSAALYESTLPAPVLDAVSSQISILKSPTCLRLEDGTFYGWEGCSPESGCCEGTCTHVWNYAQALPFLFPSLERSIRDSDYAFNLHGDGHMTFRMPLPLGVIPEASFHAAADGQLGGIMKVYREWLVCGDEAWLRKVWPQVKQSLGYAFTHWDKDKDGVIEGVQHNTYDIEFHGPNTMIGSFYLGALRAAEEMARHLDESDVAAELRRVFESGSRKMDETLFNGEFYIHDVKVEGRENETLDPKSLDFPKYQYGIGCLSDQMIGQWFARLLHLGDLFDADKVRKTMASIFRYNWKSDLSDHPNPQRIYAVNDEAGLLLASWPRGGRPALPFVYSDEVWCGIEYQVASHLIYEGLVEEGIAVVKGVRDRHTGVRRNPWNEFECGHHYARSMASYSVLVALSDLLYTAHAKRLHFAPRVYQDDFACFLSVDSGWGVVRQSLRQGVKRVEVDVRYGELALRTVSLGFAMSNPRTISNGGRIECSASTRDGRTQIALDRDVTLRAGQTLSIVDWE